MERTSMISLATVKTFLGLTGDATYDASITAMIPIAEATYREIAGSDFNNYFAASYYSGETSIQTGAGFNFSTPNPNSPVMVVKYGDIVTGTGIPAETYITAIDKLNGTITISDTTTDNGAAFYVTTNIKYRPVISGLIWYLIGQQSTTAKDTQAVKSKSVGPLALSYADGEINTTYGVPQKIVDAIPKYVGLY